MLLILKMPDWAQWWKLSDFPLNCILWLCHKLSFLTTSLAEGVFVFILRKYWECLMQFIKAWNGQYNSAWCNLYKSFEYSSGMCEAYYQSLEEGLICFERWSKNNFLGNNFHLASGSNNTLLKMQLELTGWLCSNLACMYLLTELYLWKTDSDFSRQKSNFFQSSYSKFLTYLISYQLECLEHYQFILWQ